MYACCGPYRVAVGERRLGCSPRVGGQGFRGGRLMFRLKSALSAVSMAAGVAVVVAIFVVSAGALPTPNTESPSEVQYDDEGVASTGPEGEDPGPGYYHFYDRWTDEDASSATASSELAPSEGADPSAQAPESARAIMEPPTPYSQVVDNASSRQFYSAPDW